MPFEEDGSFSRLGDLTPNSRTAKVIDDVAAAITQLARDRFTVDGVPGTGQVPKWNGTEWVTGDDETATAGSGEANVQSDLRVTDTASDAFVQGKETLFSGDYDDLANLPPPAPPFNVNDLVQQLPEVADDDRLAVSDQSTAGKLDKYVRMDELADYIQGVVELAASRIVSGVLDVNRAATVLTKDEFDALPEQEDNRMYLIEGASEILDATQFSAILSRAEYDEIEDPVENRMYLVAGGTERLDASQFAEILTRDEYDALVAAGTDVPGRMYLVQDDE